MDDIRQLKKYYLDHEAAMLFNNFYHRCIVHQISQGLINALTKAYAKKNKISLKTISRYNLTYAREMKMIADAHKIKILKAREIFELFMGKNHIWSAYFRAANFLIHPIFKEVDMPEIDLSTIINKAMFFLSDMALVGEVTCVNEDKTINVRVLTQTTNQDKVDFILLFSVVVPKNIPNPDIKSKVVVRFGTVICNYVPICNEFIMHQSINNIFIMYINMLRDHPERENYIDYQNFCPQNKKEGFDLSSYIQIGNIYQ